MSRPQIDSVEAIDCYALRRAVLRAGDETADVSWPEDSMAGAFHLAVRADDGIVAVASFAPIPTPHRPDTRAWQLRGMAVAVAQQQRGYGVALLDAATKRLRSSGAHVLWANARDSALEFYVRYGMQVVGDRFVAALGLPHHVVILDLVPDPAV